MTKKDWSSEDFVTHWKYYESPARAIGSELEFVEKKIKEKGPEVKVLILGSTPEYRNICVKLGIKVTLLDFSKDNYEYLSDEVKDTSNETFVEGNWLKTKLGGEFDIILGDHAPNMLNFKKEYALLFENVSKMLKKDGFFIPRTYIRFQGENITPEEVIKKYEKIKKKYGIIPGSLREFFLSAYDYEKDECTLGGVFIKIKEMCDKGLLTDEELDFFENKLSLKDRDFHFSMPEIKEFEKLALEYFEIVEVFYGTEPYLEDKLPMHVFKGK